MKQLARFFEEIHLGEVINPHTNHREVLTEMVTVCPSCHSLHSLRHDGDVVHCVHCYWSTPATDHASIA
jgi:ribosomal protein L37AE/L43A